MLCFVCVALPTIHATSLKAQNASFGSNTNEPMDLSLEQLVNIQVDSVYGASRYEQKVTRAPASVTIVTSDEITKQGYRNLADVLRSVPGFYVTYERNYSNIGIRGFDRPGDFDTRLLLLVNGHRVNDNLYDSAAFGSEAVIDVDLVDRVEVIRGPSSSIYGSSAFFGVINIVTRTAGQINGVEASASAGSLDTYRGRFTYGNVFTNDLEIVLSGSVSDSSGNERLYYKEFDTPANNHGVAVNSDAEYAENLYGSITYHDLTLTGGYNLRQKHVPTASYGTIFNDGRERTVDDIFYVDLKYQHDFENELQMMARVYYDYYNYYATYPYNIAAPGDPVVADLFHDNNWASMVGSEVQFTKKVFDKHILIVGSEIRDTYDIHQNNYDEAGIGNVFLDERSKYTIGVYGQAEVEIKTNLFLNGGLRFDYNSIFGGELSPRVALIYNPLEHTTLKAIYGQAYRAPNAYELYQVVSGYSEANLSLRPETIRTYELVCEQYFAHDLRLSACGYFYDISELITQELMPDGLYSYQNVSSVTGKGIELAADKKFEDGTMVRLSYALQRADNNTTHRELDNSPRHLAKLNVIVPVYKDKIFTGLELQYMSEVNTIQGNKIDGFVIANLTLFSQRIVKNLELSATVYNLLDTHYSNVATTGQFQDTIPQDGRSFRVKLTYRF